MKTNDSRIVEVSGWRKVSEIPASDSLQAELDAKHTCAGIYQVALASDVEKIGDNLIHEDICYTGESGSIHARTYTIRQPRGSHGASVYIRENGLSKDEVLIRYCYTDQNTRDHKSLESEIHATTTKMFGKKFKWKEASAGNDGRYTRILDDMKRLTSAEMIAMKSDMTDIYFEIVQREAIQNWDEA